jgi:hypothetical protein
MIRLRVGLWFCRVMRWHLRPYEVAWVDAVNTKAVCLRCGYVGLVDSQGNLF